MRKKPASNKEHAENRRRRSVRTIARRVPGVAARLSASVALRESRKGVHGRRGFSRDDFEVNWQCPPEGPEGSKRVILRRAEESGVSRFMQPMKDAAEMKVQLSRATDTLAELCELLEEYGPQWYTQHQQERAESTLRMLGKR